MSEEQKNGTYPLDDENVAELGRFLQAARLSNGTVAQIPAGMSELVAQAVLNWFANQVFDDGQWITRADLENDPLFGEVEVTVLGDDEAVKLRHRTTGAVALGLTKPEAWRDLRDKVRAIRRGNGDGVDE